MLLCACLVISLCRHSISLFVKFSVQHYTWACTVLHRTHRIVLSTLLCTYMYIHVQKNNDLTSFYCRFGRLLQVVLRSTTQLYSQDSFYLPLRYDNNNYYYSLYIIDFLLYYYKGIETQ